MVVTIPYRRAMYPSRRSVSAAAMKRDAMSRLMAGPGERRRAKRTGMTPIRSREIVFGRL